MPREMFRLAYNVRMSATDGDVAEMMLYGEIIEDLAKWYKEQYPNDMSASDFKTQIDAIRSKGARKLLLRINSPGGVCTQSVAMRSILSEAGFDEINILIEGLCASAATDIATLPGAHVRISEGSEYMIHNPVGGVYGDATALESYAARLRNIERTTRGFYAKRTGQSDEQIKRWMDAETWFTAEDAVKFGFADEVATVADTGELPAAACVTHTEMAVMRGLYRAVPEQIAVRDAAASVEQHPTAESAAKASAERLPTISNGSPYAGEPSEITNHEEERNMEIKELTMEQLRAENPALMNEILQNAVAAERARVEDIDALTLPGYEQMAEEAKAKGTSAADFQRQLVQAVKQKGRDFMQQRAAETKKAATVTGGTPQDNNGKTEDQEIEDAAKEILAYAKGYSPNGARRMF